MYKREDADAMYRYMYKYNGNTPKHIDIGEDIDRSADRFILYLFYWILWQAVLEFYCVPALVLQQKTDYLLIWYPKMSVSHVRIQNRWNKQNKNKIKIWEVAQ